MPPDAAAQAFLDIALDRVLRAWADGGELTLDVLAAERPDLRGELEELIATARETAIVRPQPVPQIPGYEVLHEIGRGGMGIVYAARQQGLDRLVALKVLPEFLADSERSRRRFLAEAKNLARVRHPHVVTIVDVFEVGSLCAYAMEWIDGKSLADLLHELGKRRQNEPTPEVFFGGPSSQRLPPDAVVWFCRLGIAIARALAEVHRCGLVHRDVKPSNILLRADGTPLLSDFGLVRDESVSLTRSGQIVGTLAFAAPEQLRGANDRIGPASDLFALGATLHWAVSGTAPFAGETAVELCANIEARARQPLTKTGLSRDLETIIGKCLEPRAEDRYATADAVADDLENLLALRPIAARPLGALPRTWRLLRRNRRAVVAAALSGIVVLVASVLLMLDLANQAAAPREFEKCLRVAQGALLEEFHAERLGLAARGETMPPDRFLQRTNNALKEYSRAFEWMKEPGVTRERDVVELANKVLKGIAAARPEARPTKGTPPPPLPEHFASDARLRGLYEFLLGDVRCHETWADLDLAPGKPDPLVDAASGQRHLEEGSPGKAYPRLLRAFVAWPDEGFLAVAVADCAVRLDDLATAERYLDVADSLHYPDPSKTWVRGQLHAARGNLEEARDAYESVVWHLGLANQEHARMGFVQLLQQLGEPKRALDLLLPFVENTPDRARHGRRLGEVADAWWANLPMPRKEVELLQCWNNSESWPLLRRLARVRAQIEGEGEESRGTTTRGLPGSSHVVHRQEWSMSTLPLEFTMMTSRECRMMRAVPKFVQHVAAWTTLHARGLVAQRFASVAPVSWSAVRLGTLPSVLAAGWVLALLAPDATGQIQWVNHTPASGAPSARAVARGAFDAVRGQVVVHGGNSATGGIGDLWSWDRNTGTWISLPQPTGPGVRFHSSLVSEGASSLLLFGGTSGSSTPHVPLGDTWRWDGTAWTELLPSPAPSARQSHAMCYDSHRGVVVLYGGYDGSIPKDDTWEWSGGTWVLRSPVTVPPALHDHTMTYDPVRQRVVLFGGNVGAALGFAGSNQTWEWDGANWTDRTEAVSPSPRFAHGMCWDSNRGRTVVFGGWTDSTFMHVFLNDLWEWDGNTWTQRTPASGSTPSGRYGHVLVYDPVHRDVVLFGGKTGPAAADVSAETWVLEPVVAAEVTNTGPGCAGAFGSPSLTAAPGSLPWIGDTLTTHVNWIPSPPAIPILVAGFSNPTVSGLFCRPDCTLRATPDILAVLNTIGNQASWSIALPNDSSLIGVAFFAQTVSIDLASLCTEAMSNGIKVTIGGR